MIGRLEAEGRELSHPAGTVLVREGDAGTAAYVLAEGRVEVVTDRNGEEMLVGSHSPGELFGEIAFVHPKQRRMASVRAATAVRVFELPAASFRRLLEESPEAGARFAESAEKLLVGNFLQRSTPFTALSPERLRWLASRVESLRVDAGARIVEQGSGGDRCYLLQHGKVEVVLEHGEASEHLATLEPGSLIGEAALLTDEPRNATARAIEACELLALARDDLLASVEGSDETRRRLAHLVRWRDRPRRAHGVIEARRSTADGTSMTVLKDPVRLTYYQLTPEGLSIWRSLDGRATLRSITLRYLRTHGRLAPQRIYGIVEDLSRAGFVTTQHLSEAEAGAAAESWAERWLRRLARLRFWRWDVVGADAHLTAAYRRWGRFVFTPAALATLTLVAVAGLVAFIAGMPAAGAVFAAPATHPSLLLIVYPALVVSLVLHELGHALATKHFGRDVDRCGVGLYYFAPMAFVDTSDMWLEPPARRNVVNLAGLAANAVVAGLASLSALVVDQPVLDLALWFVALTNYATIVANLNPLLELDGYYVLMDTLDRPNLRGRALRWLGSLRPTSLARPRELGKNPVELAYALAALAYIALLVWLLATVYRSVLLERLSLLLPQWAALSLGYGLVLVAVASMFSGLFIEMRAARDT